MGGYIFLRCRAGLCDSMQMLEMMTPYAQKYKRTIIWDLLLYTASDLDSIFDLSKYPVPVLYGSNHVKSVTYEKVEPKCFTKDIYATPHHHGPNLFSIDGQLAQFDRTRQFDDSVLLIYYGANGGWITMDNIRFNKKLIDDYYSKLEMLPSQFDAVHLRATDHYDQKTSEALEKIDKFVKDKTAVYLASDNMSLMKSLSEKFPQVIKSFNYDNIEKKYYSLHHEFGSIDSDALKKAIIDILICASSQQFLPSVGGFSRLIWNLNKNKKLLQTLTLKVEEPIVEIPETVTLVKKPDVFLRLRGGFRRLILKLNKKKKLLQTLTLKEPEPIVEIPETVTLVKEATVEIPETVSLVKEPEPTVEGLNLSF